MKGIVIKTAALGAAALLCLALSGCALRPMPLIPEDTATPVPTASLTPSPTPEPVPLEAAPPATPTPIPARSDRPRIIGSKSTAAGSVLLTNQSGMRIRELYLAEAYSEEWGRNLIPSESSIREGEKIKLFYPAIPEDSEGYYDILVRCEDGYTDVIYYVRLADTSEGAITYDPSDGYLHLTELTAASADPSSDSSENGGNQSGSDRRRSSRSEEDSEDEDEEDSWDEDEEDSEDEDEEDDEDSWDDEDDEDWEVYYYDNEYGYIDENGEFVYYDGYYDENGNFIQYEEEDGYFDENGVFIPYDDEDSSGEYGYEGLEDTDRWDYVSQ